MRSFNTEIMVKLFVFDFFLIQRTDKNQIGELLDNGQWIG